MRLSLFKRTNQIRHLTAALLALAIGAVSNVNIAIAARTVAEHGDFSRQGESLAPLLATIQGNPDLKFAFETSLDRISAMDSEALEGLSFASVDTPVPTMDAAVAEVDRLVMALAANRNVLGYDEQPYVVEGHRHELVELLGEDAVGKLENISSKLSATTKEKIEDQVDLWHKGPLQGSVDRLSWLFDRSRGHLASLAAPTTETVIAEGSPVSPVIAKLEPVRKRAVGEQMNARELQDYIATHVTYSPMGMKEIRFQAGDHRGKGERYFDDYEPVLTQAGIDFLFIDHPTAGDRATFSEEKGFYAVSEILRSVARVGTTKFPPRKLRSTEHLDFDILRIAPAALNIPGENLTHNILDILNEWYTIYRYSIMDRPDGMRVITRDSIKKWVANWDKEPRYIITFRDKATGKLVGGATFLDWATEDMVTGGYLGYLPPMSDIFTRVASKLEEKAQSLGRRTASGGWDPFKFVLPDIGMPFIRAKIGLMDYYGEGWISLFKALNTNNILDNGYLIFTITPEVLKRYFEVRDWMVGAGSEPEVNIYQDLLGGRYFSETILTPAEAMIAHYFYFRDKLPADGKIILPALPRGISDNPRVHEVVR